MSVCHGLPRSREHHGSLYKVLRREMRLEADLEDMHLVTLVLSQLLSCSFCSSP
jgi:hypothetical protein